jgi:hypothetical protein
MCYGFTSYYEESPRLIPVQISQVGPNFSASPPTGCLVAAYFSFHIRVAPSLQWSTSNWSSTKLGLTTHGITTINVSTRLKIGHFASTKIGPNHHACMVSNLSNGGLYIEWLLQHKQIARLSFLKPALTPIMFPRFQGDKKLSLPLLLPTMRREASRPPHFPQNWWH